jgi:hypothetical protein
MTLTIELSEPVKRQLAERAAKAGKSPESYVAEMVEREMSHEKTLDEILAPFRLSVAESGMTDEELNEFFQDVREEVWQEKHGSKK